jgi:PAS domain-containing protein
VFVNRVLRRIFGLKRDEVTGGWRKLHNEELHNEMGRACSMNGEERNAYRILVGKVEGKSPLGRPRCSWVDNIKMILER